jgi:hypothetical protein
VLAATSYEVIVSVAAAVLSVHTGAIIALAVYLGRTREKIIRLEEWQRLTEKRLNGKVD